MFSLTHLDNESLLENYDKIIARERLVTAVLLAHIAEIDHRHLYLSRGFESMRAYCMARQHLTEDAAAKRIQVARLARQFPMLFQAIADGRLHMGAIRTLAPHLNASNVDDLLMESAHKTVSQVEILLAKRAQIVAAQSSGANSHATWHVSQKRHRTKIAPTSVETYTLNASFPAEMHDRLRYAQQLLGHTVPTGNVVEVLDRALMALIREQEKQKFGVGSRQTKANIRGIPARVKFTVFQRDGGRCTIRLDDGKRCGSRVRIEFDHIVPKAKGGRSSADNLRLVCRAHNIWAAEQEFGRDFMTRKRCKNK